MAPWQGRDERGTECRFSKKIAAIRLPLPYKVASVNCYLVEIEPGLEYRYDVFSITVDWTTLIVLGALVSVFFRRAERSVQP